MEYPPEEQYQAMMRAYRVLERMARDTGSTAAMNHDPVDATRRFFMECYALKDHLKKDPRIPGPARVEQFITGNVPLSLAADACNSFKHAGLDRPPRGSGQVDGLRVDHTLTLPAGENVQDALGTIRMTRNPKDGDTLRLGTQHGLERATATARVVLMVAGKQYDAFETATDCVAAWDHFIQGQGLVFDRGSD